MFIGTVELAAALHALALGHMQATVGTRHHLLESWLGTAGGRVGLSPTRRRAVALPACVRPPLQRTPHIEDTDQEEDEEEKIAHR